MSSGSASGNVRESSHPLILHKITQMRKASNTPKYLNQLLKETTTFLCYEATASMATEVCHVKTCVEKAKHSGEYDLVTHAVKSVQAKFRYRRDPQRQQFFN